MSSPLCASLCALCMKSNQMGERERSAKSGYCLIKSIQRDLMALTKPASYDMIVINESAFIATIRLVDESKKKMSKNTHQMQNRKNNKKIEEKTNRMNSETICSFHAYNVIASKVILS